MFSWIKAKELLSYGKFVAAAGIVTFLLSSIDIALIGKYLGTESLGYYTIAMSIAGMFTIQAAVMLSQVIFPTYSKMQNDFSKLHDSHLKVLKLSSIFLFPATFGIISVSSYFIEAIYGNKWLPAVQILQILCIYGLVMSFNKINSTVFLALGKPDIMARVNYIHLLVLSLFIYPITTNWGIYGTSIIVTISVTIATFYSLLKSCKLLQIKLYEAFDNLLDAIKGSFLMLVGIAIIKKIIIEASAEIMLIIVVLTGSLVYLAYIIYCYREDLANGNLKDKLRAP